MSYNYALATSQLLNLILHDKCFGRQATIKTAVSLPKDHFLLSFRLYPFGKTEYMFSVKSGNDLCRSL